MKRPKQDHEIVMLQNFADELRRKVPVAKRSFPRLSTRAVPRDVDCSKIHRERY